MKAVRFPDRLKPLLVPIREVHQHPDNPNNGDLDELITSIQRFGFVTAITVNAKTGEIVAGNHRYQALLALGATEIPVIPVETWESDDGIGYMIADNEIARRAKMDKSQLLGLLKYLQTTEKGLMGTGHNDNTLERLMMDLAQDMSRLDTPGGFGGALAPSGIFQVVVDFTSPADRDMLYQMLKEEYGAKVRTVNL